MHDTISKYVLSLGLFVLLAGDCNPTPDTKSEEAFFKQIAFTAHNVKYDFHLTPAPGTLSINDQSVNLANALQTASGATLVVDGKTYGIAYKNINDTVYLTLTLPYDVGSLPTSITLHTLLVSEKSTLVDQNGAPITEGQSLSRRNDAFITKIISEDDKKNTIYNIQLKKAIAPSKEAFFKQIAFTAHNVKYDFHLTPAPGTLSINDQSVNLANALQTASGATLVVDGKTYGIAYRNINDTVYLTLTLPYDVGSRSLPTSITLHTLLASEKSTLVDQNGAPITEGQSLSRRNDAFIAKIISEDGKKNTIYNIQLKKAIATGIPTITKLVIAVDASQTAQAIEVNLETLTALFPAGSDIPSEIVIKEIVTSPQDLKVVKTGSQDALSANSKVALEDDKLLLSVTSQSDQSKSYEIAVIKEERPGSVLSSLTLSYLNLQEENIELVGKSGIIALDMGQRMPSEVTINSYQLADNSKGATVSLSGGSALSTSTPTEVTLENNSFKLYVTPVGGGEATEYTITFVETVIPTITKLVIAVDASQTAQAIEVNLETLTALFPAGSDIPSEIVIKEIATSPQDLKVVKTGSQDALSANSKVALEDDKLLLSVTSQSDQSKSYEIAVIKETSSGSVLSSITLDYLNDDDTEAAIILTEVSTTITLEMGVGLKSVVMIDGYQLADNSKGATVSLSEGSALSISTPTKVTLENNSFKLYVTPVGGGTATEYTITFVENLYKESMLTSIQIAYGSTPETVTFTQDETEKTISLASGIGVPSDVTLSSVIVSKGASVKVGGTEIAIDKSEQVDVQDNKIELTVTSQSEESNNTYTILFLNLQAVSYSGGTTDEGKEIPVLGIAIEDNILTDDSVLISVSGLQSEAMYQYQIGTVGNKQDIESSSTGEIELKKSHVKNGGDISIKEDDAIMLYSNSNNLLGIIARYKKYEIHDWKDLQGMREDLAGGYTLENHIELPELEKAGLPKEGFDPIGTSMAAFTGSFNGKGLTISKFSINRPEKDSVGLFGNIESELTAVKDVKIAILDSVHGGNYVGCVVGRLQSGTITGVEVTEGKVSGTGNAVGGVAGENREGTITNSYATGDVSGTGNYVGGVAGSNIEGGTITNSYATGDVSGNNWVGSVAGSNIEGGTITNSYATGEVDGRLSSVGGVAGINFKGTITNSYATGDVSGGSQVGGVAGSNFNATITNSYALGGVSRKDGSEMTLNWVVGQNDGPVENNYYPYRGGNAIDGVNAHDPSADSVRKTDFENLKKKSITAQKKDEPFNDWNFATNGDWEWTQDQDLLWPLLRLKATNNPPGDFATKFRAEQINGQRDALKALQDKTADDWE